MSLLKEAYSLAAIAKQVQNAKKAGKIINSRNLEVKTPVFIGQVSVKATKKDAAGPMTLTATHKNLPDHIKPLIKEHNIRPAVYSKGKSGINLLTGLAAASKKAKLATDGESFIHKTLSKGPGKVKELLDKAYSSIGRTPHYKRNYGFDSKKSIGPEDKKAINLLTHKHELDELRASKELKQHAKHIRGSKGGVYNWTGTSHLAPSVILRESNAVRTLGAGTGGKEIYHKAKGLFHHTRTEVGSEASKIQKLTSLRSKQKDNVVFPAKNKMKAPESNSFEYKYGKTRLSRHAIKRLDQAAMRRGDITVN